MRTNEVAKVVLASQLDRIRGMVSQGGKAYFDFAKLECVSFFCTANGFKTRELIDESEYSECMKVLDPILTDLKMFNFLETEGGMKS